jgi:hypothetical protein
MKKLLLVLLSACGSTATTNSNQVAQSEIYQWYFVKFSEETGLTQASATLRIGGDTGTTVNLVSPASIKFDGMELRRSQILGTSYLLDDARPFQSAHGFVWVDDKNQIYTNTANIMPIKIVNSPAVISKAKNFNLQFAGDDFSDSDRVLVYVTSSSGQTSTIVSGSISPKNSNPFVEVKAAEMNRLFEGQASLYLKREHEVLVSDGTKTGGRILTEYETKRFPVTITR